MHNYVVNQKPYTCYCIPWEHMQGSDALFT